MKKKRKTLKKFQHLLEYGIFLFLLILVRPLSAKTVHRLGIKLGDLIYRLAGKRNQVALTNLNIAFADSKSPAEKKEIVRNSFRQMAISALQCLWLQHDTKRRVHELFKEEPKGLDHLKQCLRKNKGAFILIAHYGNWEAMGVYNGYKGVMHLISIVRRLDNPYLEQAARKLRTCSGNDVFYREESPLKIVRALKNNSCVGVMMDQNTALNSIFVDFFGVKAATPRSVALLSHRMDTPVLPVFPHPNADGTYSIEVKPELKLVKTENKEEDILNWTQQFQTILESAIREHPEAWMWAHRRWKTRPPEEKGEKIYCRDLKKYQL